ncbi:MULTISPECIES: TIGR01440 family protein [unclassified Enterococcus]|uniref:TIGR01440 family protein n=1 Tax=unclassified Enterococcus TaxID=2608891 RepID=UPI001557E69F|nr:MULTISPECIES: TIGR01440 family protein [unclassified Enterococcus]MBS7576997.1 TIGR01440 family protein [Enterococcus sp. MMGLQ5-2]MBS7584556.1 TIGR01440 family protein [Enterococcus sp. MMGLQ5-1]NPD12411.1 TIGR01440 family protein [Enterococcus sp. MMGLQ5-1]NPD36831.1 TIGR01440 family protein [Enterococcus sp. MMGLQ5-2]
MNLKELATQTKALTLELTEKANLSANDIFVLGLSSSEVAGGMIGKNSSQEIGEVIVSAILEILRPKQIHLAVQGCEHLNRALAVEASVAQEKHLEVVSVLPSLHAGGSGQLAAFKYFHSPVEVEFVVANAGIDIGDTSIGMHVKHVQIPIRLQYRELGGAHVTALASRPKLIGGIRALYPEDNLRKS